MHRAARLTWRPGRTEPLASGPPAAGAGHGGGAAPAPLAPQPGTGLPGPGGGSAQHHGPPPRGWGWLCLGALRSPSLPPERGGGEAGSGWGGGGLSAPAPPASAFGAPAPPCPGPPARAPPRRPVAASRPRARAGWPHWGCPSRSAGDAGHGLGRGGSGVWGGKAPRSAEKRGRPHGPHPGGRPS